MATTWYEQGMEKGVEKGLEEARRVVEQTLIHRFGPLSDAAREKLSNWPGDRLVQLIDRAFEASSLDEVWTDGADNGS